MRPPAVGNPRGCCSRRGCGWDGMERNGTGVGWDGGGGGWVRLKRTGVGLGCAGTTVGRIGLS